MALRKAGNQAYRALAGVLDLPGTQHLGEIDIGVATPVHELGPVVQAGLVENWWLVREVTVDGLTIETWNLRPRTPGDWSFMVRNGIVNTDGIPTDFDTFVIGAGATLGTGVATGVLFYEGGAGPTITQIYLPLLYVDATAFSVMVNADAGPLYRAFPWYYAPQGKTTNSFGARTSSSGAGTVALAFRALAAPPGVLPLSW